MTVSALRLEVKKDKWEQLQNGTYKLTITLNPTDLKDNAESLLLDFIRAPMGQIYMLGMAQVGNDERPVPANPGTEVSPAPPKKRLRDEPRSRQFQKMVSIPAFQAFVWTNYDYPGAPETEDARDRCIRSVKHYLGIESSKDLDATETVGSHITASLNWDAFLTTYEQATGRMAESH